MSKLRHPSKSNRNHKTARSKQVRVQTEPKSFEQQQSDCPYRPGTLYGILFVEGNKDYVPKAELLQRVANLTGKSAKVVGFAYQVLKSKSHRSNKNRSTELTEGDKVKLIAIRK